MNRTARNTGSQEKSVKAPPEKNTPTKRGRPNRSGRDYSTVVAGSKKGHGATEKLINLIPPHTTKLECFAGNAPLTKMIKPCERSFVVEINKTLTDRYNFDGIPGVKVLTEDAIGVLRSFKLFEAEKASE